MKNGRLRVLDAKVSFDDNALFRHDDVKALRDKTEEDAKEIEASKWDLAYVALDGNIGCMVNGAGLAMATMDIIKLYGEEPANFCDVGGGAGKEKVAAAFKIITADPTVEGHPGQHLRRHHEVRCHRRGRRSRPSRKSASRFRWSFASKAPMSSSARRSSTRSVSNVICGRRPRRCGQEDRRGDQRPN